MGLCTGIVCALTCGGFLWMASPRTARAAGNDGVTGLPSDVTSLLSIAGTWQPVDDQYVDQNCHATLANTFSGNFTTDVSGAENLVVTGWHYCGFDTTASSTVPVRIVMLRQQADGTMKVDTSSFVSDPLTNGGGSVVVADFNGDGYQDIFLAAHNESPFIAMPSTALLSDGKGGFNKVTLSDHVMAHDAELATINGVPTVVTATFSAHDPSQPADKFPLYQFKNGAFVQTLPPVLSGSSFGAPNVSYMSLAVDQFLGPGKYGAFFGDFLYGPGYPYVPPPPGYPSSVFHLGIYPFNNGDIASTPKQVLSGYFNSRSQYANISSYWGPANTHTYRMRVDDFNHDGSPDALALGSLWNGTNSAPAAVQMLQNDGTGTFRDVTDILGAAVNPQNTESDSDLQIRDLDGSGINSYASATGTYPVPFTNMTDYVWVNDGTGMLYTALFDQFTAWGSQVDAYIQRTLHYGSNQVPKFILYKTATGKYNFLALVACGVSFNNSYKTVYVAVNVPLQIDFAAMYTAPITVRDRNGSHLIRTFAGDDIIYSGNSGGFSKIDGGLGVNTVVYSGPARNYSTAQNADGSWTVKDNVGADGTDTLFRIQRLQFTDSILSLDSSAARTDPPIITGVVNGASFQPGIVPGSWVVIGGLNLSGTSRTWSAADFPAGSALPTSLGGVQVTFDGQPAAISYISSTQLNVQAPAHLAATSSVQVQYFGTSNTFAVATVQTAPALFTYQAGSSLYPAALYNGTSTLVGDPSVSGAAVRKARPGDIISLYATGIEPSAAGAIIRTPVTTQSSIAVTVASQNATVLGAALVAPGEFQINFVVPNVALGEDPLKISVGSQSSQTGVTLPVGP